MGVFQSKYAHLLDRLVEHGISFACYFLPNATEPTLVVEDAPVILDGYHQLNGKHGFVFAPFNASEANPIVLFPSGRVASGFNVDIDVSAAGKGLVSFTSENSTSFSCYSKTFSCFMEQLKAERFAKLVLSRRQVVERNEQSVGSLFLKANSSYPSAFTYLVNAPQCGLWLGATPELLLRGRDEVFQTVALAGTMPVVNGISDYQWNEKNREEQQMVTDYIADQLAKCGISNVDIEGPITVKAGAVVHLKTQFAFSCNEDINLGKLVETLHPTPAVCGLPKEDSLRFIVESESHDRSYYTGFVGVISNNRETDLYVNLRCMKVTQNQLILFAGGGITSKSIGEKEWAETEHKLQTLLSIIP